MSAIEFTPDELVLRCMQPAETSASLHDLRIARILEDVARRHRVSVKGLRGRTRTRRLAAARLALYRELRAAGLSYPAIGAVAGNRDHTTIMYALRTPEQRAEAKVRRVMREAAA